MSLICKICGNKIEDDKTLRCPRCFSILKQPPKCGDCKGCTLRAKPCDK